MKTCILILSLLFTISAFAGEVPRISNELATVKACDATLHNSWFKDFNLSQVTEASTRDTGKAIQVTLKFKATIELDGKLQPADCQSFSWYGYDGAPTTCSDDCQIGATCTCPGSMCQTPSGQISIR